ncbi:hypothetical protein Tsubulata_039454 [Turnera subulata]|uniref:WPP domain-associated protein n=1 Tax=Turnera subulata TaxID=218843 RepID=A0A9Q0GC77_9ROSI|nr:hypothetical protein Tsubulata_039454 [Turnera subulata]
MRPKEVVDSSAMADASFTSCNGNPLHHREYVEETDNLGAEILNDFDSYWKDLEDRLTISRMVSDSVIKGMVCAVEEEATEKIAHKELELARLKETLHLYHVGSDRNESLEVYHYQNTMKHGFYPSYSYALLEHDRSTESLDVLKGEAEEQFRNLKKEIDKIKASSPIMRKNSASEILGLGGLLQENMSDKRVDVDKMLDGLRATFNSAHKQAHNLVHISRSSLLEWQQDQECQAEIEGMLTKIFLEGLQQEFEQRLVDHNAQFCGNDRAKWLAEKVKEISSLRQELDDISKSLSIPEIGHLVSHRSLEQRKGSSNHTLWEGNGKHDKSMIIMPEKLELSQLGHLSKEELLHYFKTEMTKMKRDHESRVQEMTEEYFSLKRELLKERDSSLQVKKDKEFDALRKKIPEIISKLDEIILENEKLLAMSNTGSLENLRDKVESLYSENCRLRDLLADKKKEIKFLISQVYDAKEKIVADSVVRANLSKMLVDLKGSLEDAHIEASIREDLCTFLLKEVVSQIESFSQELVVENDFIEGVYAIIFREAALSFEPADKLELEDSDLEATIMQGLNEVFLGETLKEAMEKLGNLNSRHAKENEIRSFLEREVLEKEEAMRCTVEQREKLEQEITALTAITDEKDCLLQESADAMAKEKEKLELASLELNNLRGQTNQQQMLILKLHEESEVNRVNLVGALKKIESYEGEIYKLRERLELVTENFRQTAEEKNMLLVMSQEKQSFIEVAENEHRRQMDSISIVVHGLSRAVMDFESRATEDIRRNSARLECLTLQLGSLMQKASKLRRTGLQYKQKFEKRCSDLQKAEAEVDLLGDEVDNLLSLLEKIYIALDHYSPILQHYPGITEILKLVRRELSEEVAKPVC